MTFQVRRSLSFALCILATLGAAYPSVRAESQPAPLVTRVDRVEFVVGDLERSRAFFENLGFVGTRETGTRTRKLELALGEERISLVEYPAASRGRAVPSDTRGNDLWFQHIAIVVSDMDRAYAWLRAQRVKHVSSGPQTLPSWNPNAGGIRAFYFADPDGHTLEIIQFPRGKGDPRWQTPLSCTRVPVDLCLFRGIDHTAITVEDTDRSLAFYRDQLGLRVAGETENHGTEQEHLNGVFGARLRITALRAKAGPGIELLEYLAPRGGRPMPEDVRESDLFHWQIVVQSDDPARVRAAATRSGGRSVSAAADSALVRDRDGHALLAQPTPRATEP